jgi:hypothetical protein
VGNKRCTARCKFRLSGCCEIPVSRDIPFATSSETAMHSDERKSSSEDAEKQQKSWMSATSSPNESLRQPSTVVAQDQPPWDVYSSTNHVILPWVGEHSYNAPATNRASKSGKFRFTSNHLVPPRKICLPVDSAVRDVHVKKIVSRIVDVLAQVENRQNECEFARELLERRGPSMSFQSRVRYKSNVV